LSSAIQKELREATGGLPVGGVRTMEEILSRSTASENFNTLPLTIFGCAAMLPAAIGIYGLTAFSGPARTGNRNPASAGSGIEPHPEDGGGF
jgi:putative ABC transport system permease protein